MFGLVDYTHWEWKNYPIGGHEWQQEFGGGNCDQKFMDLACIYRGF
jgi:hypothetical protein